MVAPISRRVAGRHLSDSPLLQNLRELVLPFRSDGYAESSSDYIVHEQYVDQAALDFHSQSAHGAHYFPRMRALFDKIDVEYFDGVVS